MDVKPLLRIIPVVQSASLVSSLLKKKKKKNLIGLAVGTMMGTALIRAESDLIEGM